MARKRATDGDENVPRGGAPPYPGPWLLAPGPGFSGECSMAQRATNSDESAARERAALPAYPLPLTPYPCFQRSGQSAGRRRLHFDA